jgi:hypothetical protein
MRVVESATEFDEDLRTGTVVIESNCSGPPFQEAFDELQSQRARDMAIAYAQQAGMSPARINAATVNPYPVNEEGLSLDEIKDAKGKPLPATDPRMAVKRYRVSVPVCTPAI